MPHSDRKILFELIKPSVSVQKISVRNTKAEPGTKVLKVSLRVCRLEGTLVNSSRCFLWICWILAAWNEVKSPDYKGKWRESESGQPWVPAVAHKMVPGVRNGEKVNLVNHGYLPLPTKWFQKWVKACGENFIPNSWDRLVHRASLLLVYLTKWGKCLLPDWSCQLPYACLKD